MEVGDWYYAVCLKKKNSSWGLRQFGLRHFNMNFIGNLHQC